MAIVRVTQAGSNIILHDSDGSRMIGYQGTGGLWFVKDSSPSGGGDGGIPPGGGGGGYRMKDPLKSYTGMHWQGEIVTYGEVQCLHAWKIIKASLDIKGITKDMVIAALMCALVESVLWMYANPVYPESFNYPHDMVASDYDSVGLFQQRPSIPWGTVQQCMSHDYSTRAFIGGPDGPNKGSPQGLLDLTPAWTTYGTLGEAVQDVQDSAHPDRYDRVRSTATGMFEAMTEPIPTGGGAGKVIDPLPGRYDASDPFGHVGPYRTNPHRGSDWNGVPEGTNLPAMAGGEVVANGWGSVVGNHVSVKMRDFPGLFYAYIHLVEPSPLSLGRQVNTGEIIGRLGNTGSASYGAHLHVTLSDTPNVHFGYGAIQDPWKFIQANK